MKQPKYFFFTTVWGPAGCGLVHSVKMHRLNRIKATWSLSNSFKQGLGGAYWVGHTQPLLKTTYFGLLSGPHPTLAQNHLFWLIEWDTPNPCSKPLILAYWVGHTLPLLKTTYFGLLSGPHPTLAQNHLFWLTEWATPNPCSKPLILAYWVGHSQPSTTALKAVGVSAENGGGELSLFHSLRGKKEWKRRSALYWGKRSLCGWPWKAGFLLPVSPQQGLGQVNS